MWMDPMGGKATLDTTSGVMGCWICDDVNSSYSGPSMMSGAIQTIFWASKCGGVAQTNSLFWRVIELCWGRESRRDLNFYPSAHSSVHVRTA